MSSPAFDLRTTRVVEKLVPNKSIEKLCSALVTDLKKLCKQAEGKGGLKRVQDAVEKAGEHRITYAIITSGENAGTYIGFGLGQSWLGLQHIGGRVVRTLRKRFKKTNLKKICDGSPTQSLMGPVSNHYEIYDTPEGRFQLSFTYTWFVKRKIG